MAPIAQPLDAPTSWVKQKSQEAKAAGVSLRELTEGQALHKAAKAAEDIEDQASRAEVARIEAEDSARRTKLALRRTEKALAEILALNKVGNMAVTVAPAKPVPPAAPDKLLKAWFDQGWALICAGNRPGKLDLLHDYQDLYLKILRDLSDLSPKEMPHV
ncbi:MAG: tektin family protein [Propionibacteriaceae bacterium]|nr:tektin family protein [Propionibacteriaceae bacterium]